MGTADISYLVMMCLWIVVLVLDTVVSMKLRNVYHDYVKTVQEENVTLIEQNSLFKSIFFKAKTEEPSK